MFKQRKLLIVEDNDTLYEAMQWRLEREFTLRDADVVIERATTFTDAKNKMRTFSPAVVSVDMSFPLIEHGMIERDAGVKLVAHIEHRHRVPCVVYSAGNKEDIQERLGDAGVSIAPPIFEKGMSANDEAWAREVMDLLLRHG